MLKYLKPQLIVHVKGKLVVWVSRQNRSGLVIIPVSSPQYLASTHRDDHIQVVLGADHMQYRVYTRMRVTQTFHDQTEVYLWSK